jgi:hypothetical protein
MHSIDVTMNIAQTGFLNFIFEDFLKISIERVQINLNNLTVSQPFIDTKHFKMSTVTKICLPSYSDTFFVLKTDIGIFKTIFLYY